MKLISINVGRPRLVMRAGEAVSTAIFKTPVPGRVMLRTLNLDGDRQADLNVHGGPTKAVYAYPSEHYEFWRRELPDTELPLGMFGENFTTEGLTETSVRIGDQFRIGEAVVMVTEPRLPCYKLGIRFGRSDILKRFLASGRTGFYLSVVQEGAVEANDSITPIRQSEDDVTVADIVRLYAHDGNNADALRRAIQVGALPESWRKRFQQQLEKVLSTDSES
ncbi:MAG: MOSC domain-containing protein [Pyrinomonadaceae bacterium]|nr:MOSC domain-containing protein [Pyrinomonadaceae bacterium]